MRHFHPSFRPRGNAMKRPAASICHPASLTVDVRESSPLKLRKVPEMTLTVCLESGLKTRRKRRFSVEKWDWQCRKKVIKLSARSLVDSMGFWRPWNACPITNPWSSSCSNVVEKREETWNFKRDWSHHRVHDQSFFSWMEGASSLSWKSCNFVAWKTGKLQTLEKAFNMRFRADE